MLPFNNWLRSLLNVLQLAHFNYQTPPISQQVFKLMSEYVAALTVTVVVTLYILTAVLLGCVALNVLTLMCVSGG